MTGITGACLAWVHILGFILGIQGIVFAGIGIYYTSQGRATNQSAAIAVLMLGDFVVVSRTCRPPIRRNAYDGPPPFSLDGQ